MRERHGHTVVSPKEITKMVRELDRKICKERLRDLSMFSLEKVGKPSPTQPNQENTWLLFSADWSIQRRWSATFWRCTVIEGNGHKLEHGNSNYILGFFFFFFYHEGCQVLEQCPRQAVDLHPWCSSRLAGHSLEQHDLI